MGNTAHIISHTHWDREWYINSRFTNEWLPPFFTSLFQMMEKEQDYKFVLDGQMSIVDDYLAELKKSGLPTGEAIANLKKYAGQGRLILGPYYLQPDWQLISDEAAVRNLLIGRQAAREYAHEMRVGWLLDNFGQISQAPQLHDQFGLNGLIVWRGVELDPFQMRSEFLWEAPDGTRLPCGYLLSSYRNAMRLAEYRSIFYERVRNEIEKILPFSTTSDVLLMNGYDQEMQPDDILPCLRNGKADFNGIHVIQSTPEEYMDALIEQIPNTLDVLKGALYSGRYISVFPGILSCRMYLKQQNERCQTELERYAEPLGAILGSGGLKNSAPQMNRLWKALLKNHPHDSICGVGVDDVHSDMERRFQNIHIRSQALWRDEFRVLCSNINTNRAAERRFVLFSSDASGLPRMLDLPIFPESDSHLTDGARPLDFALHSGGVTVALPHSPGVGYQTIYLQKDKELPVQNPARSLRTEENQMENRFFRLMVGADGSLSLLNKATGKEYPGIGMWEDGGDAGDEYNYSNPAQDRIITSPGGNIQLEWLRADPLKAVLRITQELSLPQSLAKGRQARLQEELPLPVVTDVTVERDSPLLQFHVKLKNTVKDHRLRMLFPTHLDCETSFTRTQFDVTEHPVYPQSFDNTELPANVKRIIIGARESKPATCFPMRHFCGLSSQADGAAILARGLTEYEILPGGTIALTLFRSVGFLARADLNTRIGDAGPEIHTPEAQCLREMEFDCAFYPFSGGWKQANVMGWSEHFCVPPVWAEVSAHTGGLPDCLSWLSLDDPAHFIGITGVKTSEDGTHTIVRLFNAGDGETSVTLFPGIPLAAAWTANAAEEVLAPLPVKNNRLFLTVPAKKIVTLRLDAAFALPLSPQKEPVRFPVGRSRKPLFSRYKSLPVLTAGEVVREQERAQALEKKLEAWETEGNIPSDSLHDEGQAAAERYMKRETVRRAALEARLSALLLQKKSIELYGEKATRQQELAVLVQALRDISLKLNRARLSKRAGEYIADYYRQSSEQKKEQNP